MFFINNLKIPAIWNFPIHFSVKILKISVLQSPKIKIPNKKKNKTISKTRIGRVQLRLGAHLYFVPFRLPLILAFHIWIYSRVTFNKRFGLGILVMSNVWTVSKILSGSGKIPFPVSRKFFQENLFSRLYTV